MAIIPETPSDTTDHTSRASKSACMPCHHLSAFNDGDPGRVGDGGQAACADEQEQFVYNGDGQRVKSLPRARPSVRASARPQIRIERVK
jgi:hypothetical protein